MKSGTFWFAVLALVLLAAGVVASVCLWDWLHPKAPTTVSNSETLRNVGLLIGGALAFVFALWRGWVAERQASAAQRQAATAQEQADTAHESLLNERYQKGAKMLGNEVPSVRLGGIYALRHLASEDPEQYHIQIMESLCAFIRDPTRDVNFPEQPEDVEGFVLREDVQVAMRVIGARGDKHRRLESKESFNVDLHGTDLRGGDLTGLDLSTPSAKMPGSMPAHQAFTNAALRTDLSGARLREAKFLFTKISGVDFSRNGDSPATGLTLSQLLGAQCDAANPPMLKGLADAVTGQPLVDILS